SLICLYCSSHFLHILSFPTRRSSDLSSRGQSTTQRKLNKDSSIKSNSFPSFKRNAPKLSKTTCALSAPNNSKSPSSTLALANICACSSSEKNLAIDPVIAPSAILSQAKTLAPYVAT